MCMAIPYRLHESVCGQGDEYLMMHMKVSNIFEHQSGKRRQSEKWSQSLIFFSKVMSLKQIRLMEMFGYT